MTDSIEIEIPQDVEREMYRTAVETIGTGYVRDYYDQVMVSDLRWAYRLGYEAGKKAVPRKKRK